MDNLFQIKSQARYTSHDIMTIDLKRATQMSGEKELVGKMYIAVVKSTVKKEKIKILKLSMAVYIVRRKKYSVDLWL